MKSIKTANGNQTIKMSKSEWTNIGKKAGWMKDEDNHDEELIDKELIDKDINKQKQDGYALAENILKSPFSLLIKRGTLSEVAKAYEELQNYADNNPNTEEMLSFPIKELTNQISHLTYWMRVE